MLLTVDIGTSVFKSAIWDYEGNCLCAASVSLSSKTSINNLFEDVWQRLQPDIWLEAFKNCCTKLFNLKSVEVIVISGNGPTLVPVLGGPFKDNNFFVPADNARLWLNAAGEERGGSGNKAALQSEKYQAQVSQLMGGFVDASFFLPKILYIKNEEKDLYDRTKYFLGCPEYLAFALTGEAKTVFPCEGFDRWFWNESVLEKLNLEKEKFPPFIRPGGLFGNLLSQAADFFGFAKNIPVISGGPDFFAAILASAATEPGQACDRTGSSEGINLCTQNQVIDERLMSYAHPIAPYWNLSGIINTTGKAIKWGCDLLGVEFKDFFDLAQKSRRGSEGLVFLPYLAGERAPVWNPAARAIWQGINLSSGRSEFANSILEGIGFAIRDVLSVMEEKGEKARQLRVTGGLAGLSILNQIKADITGVEIIEGVHKEAQLLGLAVIGACFKGKYASFAQASTALVKIENRYEPNRGNAALYDQLFDKYKEAKKNC